MEHERVFQRIANQQRRHPRVRHPGLRRLRGYVAKTPARQPATRVRLQEFTFPFFRELAPATLSQVSPDAQRLRDRRRSSYSGSGDGHRPAGAADGNDGAADRPSRARRTPAAAPRLRPGRAGRGRRRAGPARHLHLRREGRARARRPATTRSSSSTRARTVAPTCSPAPSASRWTSRSSGCPTRTARRCRRRSRPGDVVMTSPPRPRSTSTARRRTSSPAPATGDTTQADHGRRAPRLGRDGAGINDNGSGSSTLLEIAERDGEDEDQAAPDGAVRLLGRRGERPARLRALRRQPQRRSTSTKIKANLNFDMLGSPNYVRFVYDGDGSDTDAGRARPGRAQIESIFTDYFASQGLAERPTRVQRPLRLRPVHRGRHPAGGLFTGAEGVKTPRRPRSTAAPPVSAYDPCYHQACDDIDQPQHGGTG